MRCEWSSIVFESETFLIVVYRAFHTAFWISQRKATSNVSASFCSKATHLSQASRFSLLGNLKTSIVCDHSAFVRTTRESFDHH